MGAPFQPEQDAAAALIAAGAIFGPSGGLYAFTGTGSTPNLFVEQPRSPYEAGNAGVNPGAWIEPSQGGRSPDPLLNAIAAGSIWETILGIWVVSPIDKGTTQDGKVLGRQLSRQIRDYFHARVSPQGPVMAGYISGVCEDAGESPSPKRNEARQYRFLTKLRLKWWNVNV